jgi:translation initiation factor 5A
MMASHDEALDDFCDFGRYDGAAGATVSVMAGDVKKGDYVVLRGCPCKVVSVGTAMMGKHGHTKTTVVAVDIMTGRKYEGCAPSSHTMQQPIVETHLYSLIDIQGRAGQLTLMDENGETREDLDLPADDAELSAKIRAMFAEYTKKSSRSSAPASLVQLAVVKALGLEKILYVRIHGG